MQGFWGKYFWEWSVAKRMSGILREVYLRDREPGREINAHLQKMGFVWN